MSDPKLIHYWTFDEANGNTATDAIGDPRATIVLDKPSWNTGHANGGVRFNPNDGARSGKINANLVAPLRTWTMAFWVQRTAEDKTGNGTTLFFLPAPPSSPKAVALKLEQYAEPGQAKFSVGVTVSGDYDYRSGFVSAIGTWNHLTFVGNAQGTKLFVNGRSYQSQEQFPAIPLPLGYIGSDSLGRETPSAIIDELRIYDEDMTEAEVLGLYKLSVDQAPAFAVTVDGTKAEKGSNIELGVIPIGASKPVKVEIASSVKGAVEYTATGGTLAFKAQLPTPADVAAAPGAMLSTHTLTLTQGQAAPAVVQVSVTPEDAQIPKFACTLSATGASAGGAIPIENDLSVIIDGQTLASGGTYFLKEVTIPMSPLDLDVTIHNRTESIVSLTNGTAPIALGDLKAGFSILKQSESPIAAKGSRDFKLRFSPVNTGDKSTEVSFRNSKQDRSPFSFTIKGTAKPFFRSREQTIACDRLTMAIIRQDGTLMARLTNSTSAHPTSQWQMVTLPAGTKAMEVDLASYWLNIRLDSGDVVTNSPTSSYWYARYNGNKSNFNDSPLAIMQAGCSMFSTCSGESEQGNRYSNAAGFTGVLHDGTFVATGADDLGGNSSGKIALPDTLMLKRGINFTVALKKDGTVRCWGNNDVNQCGVRANYKVQPNPAKLDALPFITHIDACRNSDSNSQFCLAVSDKGEVWGWGADQGALQRITKVTDRGQTQPGVAKIPGLSNIKSVFCGNSRGEAFAIDNNGNLWSWGYGGNALLGRQTSKEIVGPDLVPNVKKVVSVRFGYNMALILTEDGTPYWFGQYAADVRSVEPVRLEEFAPTK